MAINRWKKQIHWKIQTTKAHIVGDSHSQRLKVFKKKLDNPNHPIPIKVIKFIL